MPGIIASSSSEATSLFVPKIVQERFQSDICKKYPELVGQEGELQFLNKKFKKQEDAVIDVFHQPPDWLKFNISSTRWTPLGGGGNGKVIGNGAIAIKKVEWSGKDVTLRKRIKVIKELKYSQLFTEHRLPTLPLLGAYLGDAKVDQGGKRQIASVYLIFPLARSLPKLEKSSLPPEIISSWWKQSIRGTLEWMSWCELNNIRIRDHKRANQLMISKDVWKNGNISCNEKSSLELFDDEELLNYSDVGGGGASSSSSVRNVVNKAGGEKRRRIDKTINPIEDMSNLITVAADFDSLRYDKPGSPRESGTPRNNVSTIEQPELRDNTMCGGWDAHSDYYQFAVSEAENMYALAAETQDEKKIIKEDEKPYLCDSEHNHGYDVGLGTELSINAFENAWKTRRTKREENLSYILSKPDVVLNTKVNELNIKLDNEENSESNEDEMILEESESIEEEEVEYIKDSDKSKGIKEKFKTYYETGRQRRKIIEEGLKKVKATSKESEIILKGLIANPTERLTAFKALKLIAPEKEYTEQQFKIPDVGETISSDVCKLYEHSGDISNMIEFLDHHLILAVKNAQRLRAQNLILKGTSSNETNQQNSIGQLTSLNSLINSIKQPEIFEENNTENDLNNEEQITDVDIEKQKQLLSIKNYAVEQLTNDDQITDDRRFHIKKDDENFTEKRYLPFSCFKCFELQSLNGKSIKMLREGVLKKFLWTYTVSESSSRYLLNLSVLQTSDDWKPTIKHGNKNIDLRENLLDLKGEKVNIGQNGKVD